MVELSKERIAQILHEETVKKEDSDTILRSVYTRYMCLYEKYFADIDGLIITGRRSRQSGGGGATCPDFRSHPAL